MKTRGRSMRVSRSRGALIAGALVVLILVAQIVATVAGAIVATRGTSAAARDTYTYIGDIMAGRVGGFVDDASDLVRGTVSEIERAGELPEIDALTRMLADRVSREAAVSALFVGTAEGSLVVVIQEPTGFLRMELYPTGDGGTTNISTHLDARLEPISREVTESEYVLSERPWYSRALRSVTVAWTEPYVSARTGDVAVSPVEAVAIDGRIAAVVGAELDTAGLGALLDDIPIGENARAFILTPDGRVVAAPEGARSELRDVLNGSDTVPGADRLGVPTEVPTPGEPSVTGDTVRLVRELNAETGVDWVLHLEASAKDLAPGLYRFQVATYAVTAVSVLVVVGAIIFVLRIWSPVAAMRHRASTDALTGLANRYEYQRRGRALVSASAADGATVMVVALDVDNLKEVNDTHGHPAGDALLAAVGDSLLESVRLRDVAARLGGDEFAVVLRLGSRGSAVEVARRLRDDAERALRESHRAGRIGGVTAGYATSDDAGYDLRAMLAAADHALMVGKRGHKGRTYGPTDAPADLVRADSLPGN